MYRIDSNGQKWVNVGDHNKRAVYEFKDKWIVLRSVKDNKLMSLFPDKFGIIFKYEEIDLPFENTFDRRSFNTYEVKGDRREAFGEFMDFINYHYDKHKFAILPFSTILQSEDQLKQINKHCFQAICSCGYRSRIYKNLRECNDESDHCCKCGDLLDIVRI